MNTTSITEDQFLSLPDREKDMWVADYLGGPASLARMPHDWRTQYRKHPNAGYTQCVPHFTTSLAAARSLDGFIKKSLNPLDICVTALKVARVIMCL